MSINNEKVRMYRLPIYRVALVRETSQPSVLNCIKTLRNVYEIGATYLEGGTSRAFCGDDARYQKSGERD
jgi:hypothetical protein